MKQTYRADIDGLRALAVALVIGYHALPRAIPGGFVGVDVFFVISGYLISGLVLERLEAGSFTFHEFYYRRIRRIFPALVAVLVACYVAGWIFLLPFEFEEFGKHVAWGAAFASNFILSGKTEYFGLAAQNKPLLHLWSLGIEEQFYIVWPLILFLSSRAKLSPLRAILPLLGFSLAYCLWRTGTESSFAYYSPFTRFWELLLGGGLAAMALRGQIPKISGPKGAILGTLGILSIAGAAFAFGHSDAYPGWRALFPTLGTGLLIATGPDGWVNKKLLSLSWLVGLGLISYPLYLWHWPLFVFALLIRSEAPSPPVIALVLCLSLGLATATYLWVERPIRRLSLSFKPTVALVSAMATLGAMGFWTFTQKGLSSRMPPEIRAITSVGYEPISDPAPGKCWLEQEDRPDSYSEECIGPSAKDTHLPLLVVWGDSHAGRLLPGIRNVYGKKFRIGRFFRNVCPPGAGKAVSTACDESNAIVLKKILRAMPEVVVMFAAWNRYDLTWEPDRPLSHDLQATIRELKRAGLPRVVLVGPPGQWKDKLPRLLLQNWRKDPWHSAPERMKYGIEPAASTTDAALDKLVSDEGIAYFSAYRSMCDVRGCLIKYGSGEADLMTWDYGHLTPGGAEFLAQRIPLFHSQTHP